MTKGIGKYIEMYTLPVSIWIGMGVYFGWLFGFMDAPLTILMMLFSAGMAAMYGLHALEMGWYDDDDST